MSQNEKVLKHLQTHKSITSIEAINLYGITRLAARISDLRAMGHRIAKEEIFKKSVHFSIYRLMEE